MSEEQAKYKTKSEDNFKTRLYAEHGELTDKIIKLNGFIVSDAFKTVSFTQSILLIKQLNAMRIYHQCLYARIKDIEEQERKEKKKLDNIDIDEWLLDNNISIFTRIKIEGANRSDYLSDILEKFLKEQIHGISKRKE